MSELLLESAKNPLNQITAVSRSLIYVIVAKHSCAFVGGVGSLKNKKKINYAREKSSSNYSTLVKRIE